MSYARYLHTNHYQVFIRFGETVYELTKKDPARGIQSYFGSCNLTIPCTDVSGSGTGSTGNLTLKDYDGKLFQVIVARAQKDDTLIKSLLMYYESQGDSDTDVSQLGSTDNSKISVRIVIHTWSGTRGFNFFVNKLNYTGLTSGIPALQLTLDYQAQNTKEGSTSVSQEIIKKYNSVQGIAVESPYEALDMLTKDFNQNIRFEKEPNVYVELKDWNDTYSLKFFNNISNYRISFLASEIKPNANIVKSEIMRIVSCMYDKEDFNYTGTWKVSKTGQSVLIIKQTKDSTCNPTVDTADCDVYPSQCIFTWYLSGTQKEITVGSVKKGTSTRRLAIPIESVELDIDQNKIFESTITNTYTTPNGTFIFTPHGSSRTTESAASLKLRLSTIAAMQQLQGMKLQITVLNFITFDMNDKVEVAGYDALQQPSPVSGVWKVSGNMNLTLGPVIKTTVDLIYLDPNNDGAGGVTTQGILDSVRSMESNASQEVFEKINNSDISSGKINSYTATKDNKGLVVLENGIKYDITTGSLMAGSATLDSDGTLTITSGGGSVVIDKKYNVSETIHTGNSVPVENNSSNNSTSSSTSEETSGGSTSLSNATENQVASKVSNTVVTNKLSSSEVAKAKEFNNKENGRRRFRLDWIGRLYKVFGLSIPSDFWFNDSLVQAVASYQEDHNIKADGKIGASTRKSLEKDYPVLFDKLLGKYLSERTLVKKEATTEERFDYYRSIIEAQGGCFQNKGCNILGIRGATKQKDGSVKQATVNRDKRFDSSKAVNPRNDDMIVTLWIETVNGKEVKYVNEYLGSVDPQGTGTNNGFGTAHLRDGQYVYKVGTHPLHDNNTTVPKIASQAGSNVKIVNNTYTALNPVSCLELLRDSVGDNNRILSDSEFDASVEQIYLRNSAMVHPNGVNIHTSLSDSSTSSTGCQNVIPSQYSKFIGDTLNGKDYLLYTLIDSSKINVTI